MAATKVNVQEGLEWHDWIWIKPARYREQGVDVLPMLGAPRAQPAPHVLEASKQAAGYNTDIDVRGTQEFREAVAERLALEKGITADPGTEIVATNGAMNAMFIALTSLLEAGDEVIIPTPHFYYWNTIRMLNGVPVMVPCSDKDEWAWDLEAIDDAVSASTKAIVFTNPCNPTGFMPSEEHLRGLGEIAERNDLVLIEDQTYERFSHIGRPITSAASVADLWERTLIVYSFHKNYSLHAWRAGYVAGPAHLTDSILSVAVWVNLRVNHISQAAAVAAMTGPLEWMDDVIRPYSEGRNLLLSELADDPGITMSPPISGCSQGLISVDGLGLPADQVAETLLADHGVPTVPHSCFGPMRDSGEHVRISFAMVEGSGRSYDEVIERLKAGSAAIRDSS